MPIDAHSFVELVRQTLECHDASALTTCVRSHWSDQQIITLLDDPKSDVRKLAALVLGFIGDRSSIPSLANSLKDPDPVVNQMAEHALWTLWFRSGNNEAQERLHQGTRFLDAQQPGQAIGCFSEAIRLDPTFSEAFNQRAIAHYLREDFPATMDDCELVVRLMPCHFGAWAGMGHCHTHLANHEKAIRCYRRALSINPYLHGVRQILQELRLGCCQLHPPKVRR